MHSLMPILRHSVGVATCCALFLAGKLVAEGGRSWAGKQAREPDSYGTVCKIFLYSGKFFEVVALVGGFIEAVAVMVLASGWLIELVTGFGLAE
jgi:hypothetical protein